MNAPPVTTCRLRCGARMFIADPHEFIQEIILRTGQYEPPVTRLVTALVGPGDRFIDVGANIGYFSLLAAARGATVDAFEPVPRLAQRLEENVALNGYASRVRIHRLALSSTSGQATLHVADRPDDGSHSLVPGVAARRIDPIEIETATLDEFMVASPLEGKAADGASQATRAGTLLIKIDVEGAEALVLDGARRLLTASHPPVWIVETADRLADSLGESAASVVGRFIARGYAVFRFPHDQGPWTAVRGDNVGGDWANYVMVSPQSPQWAKVRALVEASAAPRLARYARAARSWLSAWRAKGAPR